MLQQATDSPQVEVLGSVILSMVKAMTLLPEQAQELLVRSGLYPLEPGRWYPLSGVLSCFHALSEQIGPNTVRSVGRRIPETATFPPGLDSLDTALRNLDKAYRMNHKGTGHIGGYYYRPLGERRAHMVCDNPYPCDLDRGIIEALAERFSPKGSLRVKVEHAPGECRKEGAQSCTYLLQW